MVQWANRCLRPLLAAATLCVLWGAFLCAKIHVNTEDVIFLAAESPASNSSTELNFADTFLALNSSMTSFHSNQHHHQINFVASSMVVEAADVPAALEPKGFLSFSVFQVFAFRGIFFFFSTSHLLLQLSGAAHPSAPILKAANTPNLLGASRCEAAGVAFPTCAGNVVGMFAKCPRSSTFAPPTPQELAAAYKVCA